jgi:hypothetical protein
MVGKTSISKAACNELPRAYTHVYLNLYGVNSSHGLLEALAHGISSSRNLYEKIKDTLGRIEQFSVGPSSFSVKVPKQPISRIWDILSAIGSLKHNTVFILDEVQELYVITGHMLKLLANVFNTYDKITFMFTGSMIGLTHSLLEPKSTSPLYGRSPAKIYVEPFKESDSNKFLEKGFNECDKNLDYAKIKVAVSNLDGIPGWLTLYGNNVAIRKLSYDKAMEETRKEAAKIIKDELNHFLSGRDRSAHIQALKAASYGGISWTDIKNAIGITKKGDVNAWTVTSIIDGLVNAMYLRKDDVTNTYTVPDPLVRYTIKTIK